MEGNNYIANKLSSIASLYITSVKKHPLTYIFFSIFITLALGAGLRVPDPWGRSKTDRQIEKEITPAEAEYRLENNVVTKHWPFNELAGNDARLDVLDKRYVLGLVTVTEIEQTGKSDTENPKNTSRFGLDSDNLAVENSPANSLLDTKLLAYIEQFDAAIRSGYGVAPLDPLSSRLTSKTMRPKGIVNKKIKFENVCSRYRGQCSSRNVPLRLILDILDANEGGKRIRRFRDVNIKHHDITDFLTDTKQSIPHKANNDDPDTCATFPVLKVRHLGKDKGQLIGTTLGGVQRYPNTSCIASFTSYLLSYNLVGPVNGSRVAHRSELWEDDFIVNGPPLMRAISQGRLTLLPLHSRSAALATRAIAAAVGPNMIAALITIVIFAVLGNARCCSRRGSTYCQHEKYATNGSDNASIITMTDGHRPSSLIRARDSDCDQPVVSSYTSSSRLWWTSMAGSARESPRKPDTVTYRDASLLYETSTRSSLATTIIRHSNSPTDELDVQKGIDFYDSCSSDLSFSREFKQAVRERVKRGKKNNLENQSKSSNQPVKFHSDNLAKDHSSTPSMLSICSRNTKDDRTETTILTHSLNLYNSLNTVILEKQNFAAKTDNVRPQLFESTTVEYQSYIGAGLIGVSASLFGVILTLGALKISGMTVQGFSAMIPFLSLGIGIDDMFILVNAWRLAGSYDIHQGVNRIRMCLRTALPSMTLTTLTTTISFAIGSTSDFSAVRKYCIQASLTLATVLIFQLSLTLPYLVLNENGCISLLYWMDFTEIDLYCRTCISELWLKPKLHAQVDNISIRNSTEDTDYLKGSILDENDDISNGKCEFKYTSSSAISVPNLHSTFDLKAEDPGLDSSQDQILPPEPESSSFSSSFVNYLFEPYLKILTIILYCLYFAGAVYGSYRIRPTDSLMYTFPRSHHSYAFKARFVRDYLETEGVPLNVIVENLPFPLTRPTRVELIAVKHAFETLPPWTQRGNSEPDPIQGFEMFIKRVDYNRLSEAVIWSKKLLQWSRHTTVSDFTSGRLSWRRPTSAEASQCQCRVVLDAIRFRISVAQIGSLQNLTKAVTEFRNLCAAITSGTGLNVTVAFRRAWAVDQQRSVETSTILSLTVAIACCGIVLLSSKLLTRILFGAGSEGKVDNRTLITIGKEVDIVRHQNTVENSAEMDGEKIIKNETGQQRSMAGYMMSALAETILVITTLCSIFLGVFGYTALLGYTPNFLSLINYLTSIGLSVDYCIHITETYFANDITNAAKRLLSADQSKIRRNHRIISGASQHKVLLPLTQQEQKELKAAEIYSVKHRCQLTFERMWMPILQGGASTFLGVLMLSTVNIYFVQSSFMIVSVVVLLGLVHALWLLPLFLTSINSVQVWWAYRK